LTGMRVDVFFKADKIEPVPDKTAAGAAPAAAARTN
jgi:hypothetical protein